MQSYGIIGVTLWRNGGVSAGKRQYPYVETTVPRRETAVSKAGNDSPCMFDISSPAWLPLLRREGGVSEGRGGR